MDIFSLILIGLVIGALILFSEAMKGKKPAKSASSQDGWNEIKFFLDVHKKISRDYTLIIDRSGSMASKEGFFGPTRWQEAEKAIQYLAPHVTECDPDGVTIYFFSGGAPIVFEHVKDAEQVRQIFGQHSPSGSTNLAGALKQAFQHHFSEGGKPETILVVTDGIPDNEQEVKNVIIDATKKLATKEQLSVSFIQIGDDYRAGKFLAELDDDLQSLGAKYDIVDTLTTEEMKGMSFSSMIQKSMLD